jgi:K+-sensing histidine kinase KdpD
VKFSKRHLRALREAAMFRLAGETDDLSEKEQEALQEAADELHTRINKKAKS